MKRLLPILLVFLLCTTGCGSQSKEGSTTAVSATGISSETTFSDRDSTSEAQTNTSADAITEPLTKVGDWQIKMTIGDTEVPVTWEDNRSVAALNELLPLTVQMSMYGGFEQVGPIGSSLPRDDVQTTTSYGDIVLYSGDQIVVFYGSNSWAYTKLGHIELSEQEMTDLLGNGDVEITITP